MQKKSEYKKLSFHIKRNYREKITPDKIQQDF